MKTYLGLLPSNQPTAEESLHETQRSDVGAGRERQRGDEAAVAETRAKEPFFGVKIADLKVIAKKLKGEQALALELYATGNGDAQYLAGILVDGAKMTRAQVQSWADQAAWRMISTAIVPVAASEHPDGLALARAGSIRPRSG